MTAKPPRQLPPFLAAPKLAANIFGPDRGYKRLGGVQFENGTLIVRTPVWPDRWPADRVTTFEGYPVKWEHVTTSGASKS